jgi:transposase
MPTSQLRSKISPENKSNLGASIDLGIINLATVYVEDGDIVERQPLPTLSNNG